MVTKEFFELELWKDELLEEGSSPGTIYEYVILVTKFLKDKPNLEDASDYNKFLIKNRSVKRSAYLHYYALKKYAIKVLGRPTTEKIFKDVIKLKLKDRETQRAELTDQQIFRLIAKLETQRHRMMARIQRETGLRASSVIWLKKKNVSKEIEKDGTPVLRILVQSKGRTVSNAFIYDKVLIKELEIYMKNSCNKLTILESGIYDTEYLFLYKQKNIQKKRGTRTQTEYSIMRYCYNNYWLDLKQALSSENINPKMWATHDFRRNFAKRIYLENEKDFYLLKEALGHKRSDTTFRYLKGSGLMIKEGIKKAQQKKIKILNDSILNTDTFKKGDIIDFNMLEDVPQKLLDEWLLNGYIEFV